MSGLNDHLTVIQTALDLAITYVRDTDPAIVRAELLAEREAPNGHALRELDAGDIENELRRIDEQVTDLLDLIHVPLA